MIQNNSKTVTIESDDPKFLMHGQFTVSPRASIEISKNCPQSYVDMIVKAFNRGWIKPVAHVSEREAMWLTLGGK